MLIENQLDCEVLTGEEFLNTTESFYVLTDLLRQYERKREEKRLFCSRYVLQQTRVIWEEMSRILVDQDSLGINFNVHFFFFSQGSEP